MVENKIKHDDIEINRKKKRQLLTPGKMES
jgi:hypothetical protein